MGKKKLERRQRGPYAEVYTDASRQKGRVGAAGVLYNADTGETVAHFADEVPAPKTVPEAEYMAAIRGLLMAEREGYKLIHLMTDSELVANQYNRVYTCSADNLRPLLRQMRAVAARLFRVEVSWIPREENFEADALAKGVIDGF
jgi:ribonuclease HI